LESEEDALQVAIERLMHMENEALSPELEELQVIINNIHYQILIIMH